eukprot:scaffold56798_cov59-Phaeocystis_antarctica.AAC.3
MIASPGCRSTADSAAFPPSASPVISVRPAPSSAAPYSSSMTPRPGDSSVRVISTCTVLTSHSPLEGAKVCPPASSLSTFHRGAMPSAVTSSSDMQGACRLPLGEHLRPVDS